MAGSWSTAMAREEFIFAAGDRAFAKRSWEAPAAFASVSQFAISGILLRAQGEG